MKITAVAIGTRGDVQPLAELGQKHSCMVATVRLEQAFCKKESTLTFTA